MLVTLAGVPDVSETPDPDATELVTHWPTVPAEPFVPLVMPVRPELVERVVNAPLLAVVQPIQGGDAR